MQLPGDETAFAKQALGMGMPGQNGEIPALGGFEFVWPGCQRRRLVLFVYGAAADPGAVSLFQVQSLNRAICQTCHAYSKRQVRSVHSSSSAQPALPVYRHEALLRQRG